MSVRFAIAGLLAPMVCAAPALAAPFQVEKNKTEPLRLNRAAASVVIGDPSVADIAVFDDRMIFITGKSFGTTNLMIFDADGDLVYSNDISVISNSESLVRVVRGGSAFTYDCAPDCRAIMQPGDDPEYFETVADQYQQIRRAAEPTGSAQN